MTTVIAFVSQRVELGNRRWHALWRAKPYGLVKLGVPHSRLIFALNHIGTESEAESARSYIGEAGYTALPGYLPERPAYRIAQNEGFAITETRFHGLKERADSLIQALIDRVGDKNDG
jgi:chromosome partitioning protein